MENEEQVIDILVRHGILASRERYQVLCRIADGTAKELEARRDIQLVILDALSRKQEWQAYCNYATSLAFRFFDKAPHAWAALAYGLRRSGLLVESRQIASVGMELCPSASETMLEACRQACIEGNYTLARKYRDLIVEDSELLANAIEKDSDFDRFREWMIQQGA